MNNYGRQYVAYDYFSNIENYLKKIFEILPEDKLSNDKRYALVKQFNFLMSGLSEKDLTEMEEVSTVYNEMLSKSKEYAYIQAIYICDTFLNNMLFDSYHQKEYFRAMNECVKIAAGFYRYIKNENKEIDLYYQTNCDTIGNISR